MTFRPLPNVQVQTSYVELQGGLDLVSPYLQIRPGVCIDAGNFVPEVSGGYRRIGGYERFDGRPKPSEADYWILTVSATASAAVGQAITGAASGRTATVLAIPDSTHLVVGRLSGSLTIGETLNAGVDPIGTVSVQAVNAATTPLLDKQYTALAANDRRTDILPVPGSGPVRGVWVYDGKLYAFRDNEAGIAAQMWLATSSGWSLVATPVLLPGGKYEFVNTNFSGSATGQKMYGCDGKNKAFQFDGTTYSPITSTAFPDTPAHIAAHQNRLFLSNLGSLFLSSPGDPLLGWTGAGSTAAEIGTGDFITGLMPLPGDANTGAMAVYGRNRTSILYGSSSTTWNMKLISPDTGAIDGTVQYVSTGLGLDDRGVTSLTASQNFGNFSAATVSRAVQPFIDMRRGLATGSSVLRSQNQYRLYFSDGYGLAFRLENGQVQGVMPILYPDPVECIVSGEDIGGEEVVFFGSSNGYVYQAEVGTSFDGAEIEAWARLAYNAERGPTTRKQWRRAVLEVRIPEYAKIFMTYELDYGDFSIPIAATSLEEFAQTTDTPGSGGFWDQFTWDEFTWDAPLMSPPRYDLRGTSSNISILFFSKDAYSKPFTLQSLVLQYTPRRLQR